MSFSRVNAIALLANPGNVNIKADEPEIRAGANRLKQLGTDRQH